MLLYRTEGAAVTAARHSFFHGFRLALPIVLGYLAIGLAFGVLARTSGLSVGEVAAMSILVYAGSSQFIGAGMMAAGAAPGAIVATTFLVNLRHLLMSAALAPSVSALPPRRQAVLAFWLTDETFVAASTELEGRPTSGAFLAGLFWTSHLGWVLATVGGAWLGGRLAWLSHWGLDFALPAMFIALLVMQLNERRHLAVALMAALLSVLGAVYLPANYNVLTATVLAAAAGAAWSGRTEGAS